MKISFQGSRYLPFSYDTSAFFLPWMLMMMVFLASLTLALTTSIDKMFSHWEKSMAGTLTVQIAIPSDNKKFDIEAEIDTVVRILEETPGIREINVLGIPQLKALLQPWIGKTDLLDDVPLPRLIDVKLDSDRDFDFENLQSIISQKAPHASIDVHRTWLIKLINLAEGIRKLSFLFLALVVFSTSLAVIYATTTSLAVQKQVIELMHLMGAYDEYIARQVALRTFYLSMIGGVSGFALTVPVIKIIGSLAGKFQGGMLGNAQLYGYDWMKIMMVSLLGALLTTITTYVTVHRNLKKML